MNRAKVLDLIHKVDSLVQGSDDLSKLEIDLVKQYLRNIYEALESNTASTLKTETLHHIQPENIIAHVPASKEVIVEEPVKVVLPVSEPIVQEVIATQPIIEEPTHKVRTEEILVQPIKHEFVPINERVQPNTTLNEKLKSAPTELQNKFSYRPMKELIDFNKRFLFINELFKGSSNEFSQVVQAIDSSSTLEEATASFSSYNWDQSAQSTRLFQKLVRQRFGLE
jgi:hypothetical protein